MWLNPCPVSQASHVVITCQLSVPRWGRFRPLRHLWMSDRLKRGLSKSRWLNFWLQYTHDLLVYCCIHRMVVKNEHRNCVQTMYILANLVTCTPNRSQDINLSITACILYHLVHFPGLATNVFNAVNNFKCTF